MSNFLLPTLTRKRDLDTIIRDTLDKVLVLRFGRASDRECTHLDEIVIPLHLLLITYFLIRHLISRSSEQLQKSSRDVSKFATIALVDADAEEIQVYVKYFDVSILPSTVFFFNAHHMKMNSGYNLFFF